MMVHFQVSFNFQVPLLQGYAAPIAFANASLSTWFIFPGGTRQVTLQLTSKNYGFSFMLWILTSSSPLYHFQP